MKLNKTLEPRLSIDAAITFQDKRNALMWFAASAVSFALLFTGLVSLQKNKALELAVLTKQNSTLHDELEDAKEKMHAFDHFEKANHDILKRINDIGKLKTSNQCSGMRQLLAHINVHVQKQTVLKKITVFRPKLSSLAFTDEAQKFEISGTAPMQHNVVAFTKYIKQIRYVTKVSVEKICRCQQSDITSFDLTGKINPQDAHVYPHLTHA